MMELFEKDKNDEIEKVKKEAKEIESKLKDLLRRVKEVNKFFDEEMYVDDIGGHKRDTIEPAFEYNIKLYNLQFPDFVEDTIDEYDMDANILEIASMTVESLIEDLKEKYFWIDEIYQVGRSGGWLAIVPKTVDDLDYLRNLFDEYEENIEDYLEVLPEVIDFEIDMVKTDRHIDTDKEYPGLEFNDYYNFIDDAEYYLEDIEKVIEDLEDIEKIVKDTVKRFEEDVSSEEFWRGIISEME